MTDSDSPDEPNEEPEIVVDSDWKEQVAKERETAETQSEGSKDDFVPMDKSANLESESPAETPSAADDSDPGLNAPPPASFEVLISMLFTQAMAMLGQMPNPATGKPEVNKPFAKHYIDTLEMLGEKTKGNLSDEEANMLNEALHALRMGYVNTKA